MEWFAIIIPLISIPIMRLMFPHRVVWWELFLPILPFVIITPIIKLTAETTQVRDYERWGGWITEVRYYEDWNEWVSQTCVKQVPCGTDSKGNTRYCSETYDCSYLDYHPEYWEVRGSNGEKINITKSYYNKLKSKFGNSEFVDMHRDYHTDDGDMHRSVWPGQDKTLVPVFTEHTYENRVQVNKGVFEYPEISEEDQEILHQFPELDGSFYDPAILGSHPQKRQADKRLQLYNAKFGAQYQIRYWILLFKNQPRSVGLDQEALWKGGNKNEFVTCICVDDNNKPSWCHTFCWSPDGYAGNDTMRIEVRDFVEQQDKLNLLETVDYIAGETKQYWKRKPFAEFSYLEVEMSIWALIVIYVVTIISTGAVCYITVVNEVREPAKLHEVSVIDEFWDRVKIRYAELKTKSAVHTQNIKRYMLEMFGQK